MSAIIKYLVCASLLFSLNLKAQGNRDEAQFRLQVKKLQTLIKVRDFKGIGLMMHFPFFTAKAELKNEEYPTDPISVKEYPAYRPEVFNSDVIRLLPELSEAQLSEIEGNTDLYFAELRKLTDRGSKMYELYIQYPEPGTGAESYFSFTFGKIKGRYELIAYYGKWPVR
ncbi:hypothetical protein [Pedobacter sp. GR22-6]|uniref:hypothetical protein n=1 Tax=Pedobacter sp. GR22-6 TaxID=3127957 RepID=UPI00307F8182